MLGDSYWRVCGIIGGFTLAVALGVAVATAVLTGALLVGDSVRGSLRDLTLQRLGRIDSVVVAGHPFRAALADELANDARFKEYFSAAEPALLLNGTVQAGSGKNARRATGISVVGAEPEFWSLGSGGPATALAADEVAITEPVARELDVKPGDSVLLRVPVASAIPADSPLGEKSETSQSRTMKIGAVLPAEGIARFGLVPSQQLPRTVFVPLAALQQLLKQPGKANAILVATGEVDTAAADEARLALEQALRPRLEDYGVQSGRRGVAGEAICRSQRISSCSRTKLCERRRKRSDPRAGNQLLRIWRTRLARAKARRCERFRIRRSRVWIRRRSWGHYSMTRASRSCWPMMKSS